MPVPLPRPTKDAVLCYVLETRSSIPKGPKCQRDRIHPITGEARRSARGPCSSHDLSWTPSVTGLSLRAAPPVRLRCLGRESILPRRGGEAQNKCKQDQGGIWKVVSCRKPVKSYTIGQRGNVSIPPTVVDRNVGRVYDVLDTQEIDAKIRIRLQRSHDGSYKVWIEATDYRLSSELKYLAW